MNTIVYVDGYNLFYGCVKHSDDKWLDLYKLFDTHILASQCPNSRLLQVKFFTADIKAKVASNGNLAQLAQQNYHRALNQLYSNTIQIIKGYYSLEKARLLAWQTPIDKNKRVDVWKLEEKQTDVSLALQAYRDAAKRITQQLVFVSNDTDLVPALKAIREDFGTSIQLGVIVPVRHNEHRPVNKQLSALADWTRKRIHPKELADSQLPEMIPTKKKPIRKPEYW